jgi:quercetin dioxygenase-like cupin family protein
MIVRYQLGLAMLVGLMIGCVAVEALHAQGGHATSTPSAQPEPVKRTVHVRSDLEGLEGKEAVMFLAELEPAAVGGKHYHPGTELFYVVDGIFAHQPDGKPPTTLKAGEAAFNPFRSVHTVSNPSQTERAKVVGCLITEKGQPLSVPAH